jgi:hypothetical protein
MSNGFIQREVRKKIQANRARYLAARDEAPAVQHPAAGLTENPEVFLYNRKRQMNALFILWGTTIREHQPSEEQFYQWLDYCGASTVADAVKRTAQKARQRSQAQDPMTATDLEKYASATIRNMKAFRTVKI